MANRFAYQEARELLEEMGGSAEWRFGVGPKGGVWELKLGKFRATVPIQEWTPTVAPNALDRLYEVGSYTRSPAATYTLRPDAAERLVRLLLEGQVEESKIER